MFFVFFRIGMLKKNPYSFLTTVRALPASSPSVFCNVQSVKILLAPEQTCKGHNDIVLKHTGWSPFGKYIPMQFLELCLAFAGKNGRRRIGAVLEGRRNSISTTHHTPHRLQFTRASRLYQARESPNHNVPGKSDGVWAVNP